MNERKHNSLEEFYFMKTKLYRNLKPGDQFRIETGYGIKQYRSAIITVTRVEETQRAYFSGKRQWAVYGNYPWWWGSTPVTAYSTDKVELVN